MIISVILISGIILVEYIVCQEVIEHTRRTRFGKDSRRLRRSMTALHRMPVRVKHLRFTRNEQ